MKLLVILFWLILFFSCSQEPNGFKEELVRGETLEIEIPTDILSHFDEIKKDTTVIEVEDKIAKRESSFNNNECLSLAYLPVLAEKIPQTQLESTGAKPFGKLKLSRDYFFLIVIQQDDYGPIYYGLVYNKKENRVLKSEKLAELWGDAGDSQTMFSVISIEEEIIKISQEIETCHANIEQQDGEIRETKVECENMIKQREINYSNL